MVDPAVAQFNNMQEKAASGATPTQSFLAQLGLGVQEGVVRAVAGAPGIPADLLNMVRGISKAFGWAEEGGAFDKMMDYEPVPGFGKLFRGSDYFIESRDWLRGSRGGGSSCFGNL